MPPMPGRFGFGSGFSVKASCLQVGQTLQLVVGQGVGRAGQDRSGGEGSSGLLGALHRGLDTDRAAAGRQREGGAGSDEVASGQGRGYEPPSRAKIQDWVRQPPDTNRGRTIWGVRGRKMHCCPLENLVKCENGGDFQAIPSNGGGGRSEMEAGLIGGRQADQGRYIGTKGKRKPRMQPASAPERDPGPSWQESLGA